MHEELIATFTDVFTKLRGQVHRASTWEQAAGTLLELCARKQANSVATAQLPPPLDRALQQASTSSSLRIMRPPYTGDALPSEIDSAAVGATGIEFAIAETGTLVEVSRNDATRLVSALPRTHVGVVSAREFVPGLFDAAPRMRGILRDNPRDCVISFLSGPSRTGDIELRLTLGVHGPEEAHALILDAALDAQPGHG